MKHKSFPFKWKKSEVCALLAVGEEINKDMLRLGHIGSDKMQKMQTMNMVNDLPKFEVTKGICDSCEIGKQARRSSSR